MRIKLLQRCISFASAIMIIAAFLIVIPASVQATTYEIEIVDSYEEFERLIKENDPKYGFIKYEDIQILGEFRQYVCSSNLGGQVISFGGGMYTNILDTKRFVDQFIFQYFDATYILEDKNQIEIDLYMHDSTNSVSDCWYPKRGNLLNAQPEEMADMRLLGTEDTGYIQRGPLAYHYIEGELNDIIFQLGETCFHISGNLKNYPLNGENTVISQMLSADDAIAQRAYRKLIRHIPAQVGYYEPLIVQGVAALGIVICVCIGIVVIVKYIKKRKTAVDAEYDI